MVINAAWMNVDNLIRRMMGATAWTTQLRHVSSGQNRGKALQERFWCSLRACHLLAQEAAEAEGDGNHMVIDGAPCDYTQTLRTTLAYVLVAYNLVKLRASLLHTSGSYA